MTKGLRHPLVTWGYHVMEIQLSGPKRSRPAPPRPDPIQRDIVGATVAWLLLVSWLDLMFVAVLCGRRAAEHGLYRYQAPDHSVHFNIKKSRNLLAFP